MALVLLPLLLLVGAEAGLRLAGYGQATGFFEKISVGDKHYLVNNEDFSLRFFPPQLARWPGPVMLETPKPANTYRVFILGESAARGEPEPNYAASRYLQALLEARYPGTQFEVVNLGITAINSHVIVPLARDCARAEGDLWIIYMGNNEMVGPFGAATVFGQQAPPLGLVRLNLALQSTRLGQLFSAIGRQLSGHQANAAWGGMKMFVGNQLRADDPRKGVVYQNFARNLDDIIAAGLHSGAKILLNTVAVNLRDCPPFGSLVNSNLPPATQAQFAAAYSAARQAQAQTNLARAAQQYARAAQLDPLFPAVQYGWGECLLGLGEAAAARSHFQLACDTDALPFRADTAINRTIQEAGQRWAGGFLTCFDAAAALAAPAPAQICGAETFYEHVHFNFDGNFRLGQAWAGQVATRLPDALQHLAATNGWATQEECERRLALTDWNRLAVTETVMDRLHHEPLSGQANNPARMLALQTKARAWHDRMNPAAAQAAVARYETAINASPRDHWLRQNYAEFLAAGGDLKGATVQWRAICELLPHDPVSWYQTGRLFSTLEQWTEAETALQRALALRPRLIEAWFELGNVYLGTGQFEPARRAYLQAATLNPADAIYRAYVGKALSQLHDHAAAMVQYRQALQMQPGMWETHFALGDELVTAGQISAAAAEYAEVLRLKPDNALAHLDLGVMQARQGQYDAALGEFTETLRLDPNNQQAREYLRQVSGWRARPH